MLIFSKENDMNVITKLVALISCLFILCGCLVACNNEGQGNGGEKPSTDDVVNEGGDKTDGDNVVEDEFKPSYDRYVATVTPVYATTDAKLKDAVDAIGSPITTVSVNGDKIKIESSAAAGDVSSSAGYICVDGMLYYGTEISIGDISASSYKKAEITEEGRKALLNNAGTGASIGVGDFVEIEIGKSGKLTTYTCSGISDEARDSLQAIFSSRFAGLGAVVKVDSATYYLEEADELIDNSILSCNLIITMDGATYKLTAHIYYEYDYTAEPEITAPEDADKYIESALDEII